MTRLRGLALPLALVLMWQIGAAAFGVQSDTLSKPSDIAFALVAGLGDGSLLGASVRTLAAAGGGLLVGAALGVLFGLAFGLLPPLSRLMRVTVETLRPIPAVAILPIALLAFGFGYRMEIAIVAFACFFPMMILTEHAIGQIAPRLMEVARVLRLTVAQRVAKIVVPASLSAHVRGSEACGRNRADRRGHSGGHGESDGARLSADDRRAVAAPCRHVRNPDLGWLHRLGAQSRAARGRGAAFRACPGGVKS